MFTFFLFCFFNFVLSKDYFLIKLKNNIDLHSLKYEKNFNINEVNNIKDTFKIGNFYGLVMEYPLFPAHLYQYDFIDIIEEDYKISINISESYNTKIKNNFININYNTLFDNSFNFDHVDDETKSEAFFLQRNPVWNLDRIDQRSNFLNDKYYYITSSGENVNVFIVDTGIDIEHPEFEKRATWGFNSVDNTDTDCNGHGTHVAGTVASKSYGVSKKSTLIAVKVLGCQGEGSYSSVISGLEYVLSYHNSKSSNKSSIVNMSLGGPKSKILNKVLAELTSSGIHIVVAAGNENSNACDTSPASENTVMTVGATTRNDEFATFSNWGNCVDILAPGTEIKSTFPNDKTKILQGTSMASPLQAGIYALFLNENPTLSPQLMIKLFTTTCSKNYIRNIKQETPNCLVYSLP